MISIKHHIDFGMALEELDAGAPVFGVDHFHIVFFKQAGESENIAHVIVHHQDRFADQGGIGLAQVFENAALLGGEVAFGAMEQQDGIVEHALECIGALDYADARGMG